MGVAITGRRQVICFTPLPHSLSTLSVVTLLYTTCSWVLMRKTQKVDVEWRPGPLGAPQRMTQCVWIF